MAYEIVDMSSIGATDNPRVVFYHSLVFIAFSNIIVSRFQFNSLTWYAITFGIIHCPLLKDYLCLFFHLGKQQPTKKLLTFVPFHLPILWYKDVKSSFASCYFRFHYTTFPVDMQLKHISFNLQLFVNYSVERQSPFL